MIRRVVIQERQRFLREGLGRVLGAEPDLDVVGLAADAKGLVEVCEASHPDVVLFELDADGWDAARLAAALRRRNRMVRPVGMYRHLTGEEARRAMRAGVRASVSRGAGIVAIAAAVRGGAHTSVTPMPAAVRDSEIGSAQAPPVASLTARETEVLELIGGGCTTAEIAITLGISAKTVENHKQRVYGKLGVRNQAHAVAVALRSGILRPPSANPAHNVRIAGA